MVRPVKRLFEKRPQVKPVPVPNATATEMTDQEPGPAAQKRGLEEIGASQAAGSADLEGGDMTRRHVEVLSVDALERVAKIANEMHEPDYNIVDAHIEPDDVKIPSGKDLDRWQ